MGVAALAAAGSGVGVAFAAAGDPPVLNSLVVPSRDEFTELLGWIDQDTATFPVGGTVDWGDGTPTSTQRILCPTDRVEACELYGTHEYPKSEPEGTATNDVHTVTNMVTLTTPTGPITRTTVGTIEVRGRAMPTSDQDPFLDFGDVPAGTTSAVQSYSLGNEADADNDLHVNAAASGDFMVVGNGCEDVEPGDTCSIDIVARPRAEGEREGEMIMDLGDTLEGIDLRANGTPAPATATVTQTVTTPAATVPGPGATVTLPARTVTVQGAPPPAAQCVVPDLEGKTLTSARRALTGAKCALGTVRRPKRGTSLVVAAQTVRAGAKRTAGAKVGVRLAPKARTARRR